MLVALDFRSKPWYMYSVWMFYLFIIHERLLMMNAGTRGGDLVDASNGSKSTAHVYHHSFGLSQVQCHMPSKAIVPLDIKISRKENEAIFVV
jgi:hypothetical protein